MRTVIIKFTTEADVIARGIDWGEPSTGTDQENIEVEVLKLKLRSIYDPASVGHATSSKSMEDALSKAKDDRHKNN